MNGGIDMPKRKKSIEVQQIENDYLPWCPTNDKSAWRKTKRNESVKENAGHTENEGDCSQGFSGSILVFRFSSTRRSLIL